MALVYVPVANVLYMFLYIFAGGLPVNSIVNVGQCRMRRRSRNAIKYNFQTQWLKVLKDENLLHFLGQQYGYNDADMSDYVYTVAY